jgi:hypothetical protein
VYSGSSEKQFAASRLLEQPVRIRRQNNPNTLYIVPFLAALTKG